jgi:2-polyprenyl-6-methoxyphenol hydroxylase-like FAD-dependent oxidoreductase
MASIEAQNTSVVIAGAGPAGMCLAIELGRRGVSCVILDPGDDLVYRANATQARTMEYYRRMGLSEEIWAAGLPNDYPTDVSYHTRFGKHELARVRLPAPGEVKELALRERGSWSSPERPQRGNQAFIEPVLRKHVQSFSSNTHLLGWRLTDFQDHGDHVVVTAASKSEEKTIRISCDYLVGCDGGRSVVRNLLGIELQGEKDVARDFMGGTMYCIAFQCPDFYKDQKRNGVDRAWMYWAFNTERRGAMVAIDGVDTFMLHIQLKKDEKIDEAEAAAFAQDAFAKAYGAPLPIKFLYAAYWHAGFTLVARSFGRGRVLIVGDAAHLFTPSAGLGYNTSVEDVGNLGWKIAAVIKGYGGPGLIDSYDLERRAVAKRNTTIARGLADSIGKYTPVPQLDDDSPEGEIARKEASQYLQRHGEREFDIPGITFGARYDGSPIIVGDGSQPPPDSPNVYIPSGVPGGRAPHVWTDGARSLYDRCGQDFTLLVLGRNANTRRWSEIAAQKSIPLSILDISTEQCASEARELYGADLALIRPDLHIAWRGNDAADPEPILARTLGRTAL